jgi:cyclopropane-fatty-acyl-phospholipid synthase
MGCTVDTLTLSVQQKREAEQRIKDLGLESRVTVHLMDYRDLPPHFEHAFDAFVAIEMVEVSAKLFDAPHILINGPSSSMLGSTITQNSSKSSTGH